MIIYLTDDLIQKCNLNTTTPTHIDFFEKLAYNRQRGKYFLLGTREILKTLSQNTTLNDSSKSIYSNLYSRFPTNNSILRIVDFRISIGTTSSYSNNEIIINIDEISEEAFDQYNNLLLENTTDQDIFEKIAIYYKNNIEQPNLNFKWDTRNGGGNDTKVQFDLLKARKETYTFCLLDSDKIAETAAIGATAAHFNIPADNDEWGCVHIMNVHEIENLISKNIYINYITNKRDRNLNKNLTILNTDSPLINFLDLKKGLTKQKIHLMPNDIKQIYIDEFNLDETELECECGNNCNCIVFQNLGRAILKEIKLFIDRNNIDMFENLTESLRNIYMLIGKYLINIFCIPQKISST